MEIEYFFQMQNLSLVSWNRLNTLNSKYLYCKYFDEETLEKENSKLYQKKIQ